MPDVAEEENRNYLTVNQLKDIMSQAKESDARVLVYIEDDDENEFVVSRVGQFGVVPNVTITIRKTPDGAMLNPEEEDGSGQS